jgi:hypothetical protein
VRHLQCQQGSEVVARIRTIKPEFPQSESMGNVSREARLCFIMLWTIADDSGRLRGASRMLASLLFPYDNDAPRLMDKWLGELEAESCIQRYEVDGAQYIEIANWLDHQKIDRPSPSKFPAFDASSRPIAKPREPSCEDQGPRTKEGTKDAAREFEEFWKLYPRRQDRGHAETAFAKAIKKTPPDEILAGLKRYQFSDDPKFIPLAATWLNGARWTDEAQSPKSGIEPGGYRPMGSGAGG